MRYSEPGLFLSPRIAEDLACIPIYRRRRFYPILTTVPGPRIGLRRAERRREIAFLLYVVATKRSACRANEESEVRRIIVINV